jgi:hypothetical protein
VLAQELTAATAIASQINWVIVFINRAGVVRRYLHCLVRHLLSKV